MRKMNDLISIIIPTKDRPNLLIRAVRSALLSNIPNIEVIVADDCSKIPADNVLANVKDDRLKIFRKPVEKNYGPASSRNFGVSNASGSVLLFLDDDDELQPDYAGIISKIVNTKTKVTFGYSSYILINEQCCQNSSKVISRWQYSRQFNYCDGFKFMKGKAGFGMGFWIKREEFEAIGKIKESLIVNEDTDYFIRLLANRRSGWYSSIPGVKIFNNIRANGDLTSISNRVNDAQRLECLRKVYRNNFLYLKQDKSAQLYVASNIVKFSYSVFGLVEAIRVSIKFESLFVRLAIYLLLIKLIVTYAIRFSVKRFRERRN